MVTLLLRDKEFSVKAGTTLLAALEKVEILPESVIATRENEMILEDEILHDGEVIKLVAVISGGAGERWSVGILGESIQLPSPVDGRQYPLTD